MKPTILAVDDNESQCYAIGRILHHAGYNVIHAGTGTQALLLTLEHKPDALLLDINLPDVNGFEVCSRIKADPDTRHIPVIFHTASHGTATAKLQAEIAGATAFLTYPVERQHLLTVVKGTLAQRELAS